MFGYKATPENLLALVALGFLLYALLKPAPGGKRLLGSALTFMDDLEKSSRAKAAEIITDRYGRRKAKEFADALAEGVAPDPKA